MSLISKHLMKWREPKIKGMVTPKNILAAAILALALSVPFGFIGGNGKFSVSVWLHGLLFMSIAPLAIAMQPLLPGTLVQLTEEMIIHGPRGTNSRRTAYREIERIFYVRNCTCTMEQSGLVFKVENGNAAGPLCTVFEVMERNPGFYSVRRFMVPDGVDLEQVLKILRDKGVQAQEANFKDVA